MFLCKQPPTPLFLQAGDGEKLDQVQQNGSVFDNAPDRMLTLDHEAWSNKSMVDKV